MDIAIEMWALKRAVVCLALCVTAVWCQSIAPLLQRLEMGHLSHDFDAAGDTKIDRPAPSDRSAKEEHTSTRLIEAAGNVVEGGHRKRDESADAELAEDQKETECK